MGLNEGKREKASAGLATDAKQLLVRSEYLATIHFTWSSYE
jgi:hypothetical protein